MTVFSEVKREELLVELANDYGFDDIEEFLENYMFDGVCPGICPLCKYSTEVEPDCNNGWCEECKANTVMSGMILAGII